MRFILCFLVIAITASTALAQGDSVRVRKTYRNLIQDSSLTLLDSVVLAEEARQRAVVDSIASQYIRLPDPATTYRYDAEYVKGKLYQGKGYFLDLPYKSNSRYGTGHIKAARDKWIIIVLLGLLLYTALLNLIWNAEIKQVFNSFYSKRSLSSTSGKEESTISAGAFIGLFALFGLTFGLFLYQLSNYKNVYYSISGPRLFFMVICSNSGLVCGKISDFKDIELYF